MVQFPSATPIRVIHHWACSGGTLLSRCIAALNRVVFVSEIHPFAFFRHLDPSAIYAPTDLIRHLSGLSGTRDINLCAKVFEAAILAVHSELCHRNSKLVLRSHSHLDFFVGALPSLRPAISSILSPKVSLLELITVRHPLDSWLSIQSNGWNQHFRFSDFPEFCSRCIAMLDALSDVPVVKYEDFCLEPASTFASICSHLCLDYEQAALILSGSTLLTGGSGRSGDIIGPRSRRPIPDELVAALSGCHAYFDLCVRLSYDPSLTAVYPYSTLSCL